MKNPQNNIGRGSALTRRIKPVRITVFLLFIYFGLTGWPVNGGLYTRAAALWPSPPNPEQPPVFFCRIIHTYPHDPQAFTQGLVFEDGLLFEGTGLQGQSSLRKVTLKTGRVMKMVPLHERYFGEGLTLFRDRLIQLTWKSGVGFIYDKQTFRRLGTFTWPREGWGITTDGQHLIVSDGSHRLYFLDAETFRVSRSVNVRDTTGPVSHLNELEYVERFVLANIWRKDRIAAIDPATGRVVAWISLDELRKNTTGGVSNGIAYDHKGKRLFITGKCWPYLFEITLIPEQQPDESEKKPIGAWYWK